MAIATCRTHWGWLASLLLASANCAADDAVVSRQELLANLRHGGYVIVMRHASSPREIPDAAHVNADNKKHERQLDEIGMQSARAMGEAISRLKIPIGKVLSSPTYRALETLKCAGFGEAVTAEQLGDSGQSMMPDGSGARAAWLLSRAASVPSKGTNTLIVTHLPNITEAFPQGAAGVTDGEALIVKPDGFGGALLVTRLRIDEWSSL